MDIIWLDQSACQDVTLVGGKAAHLSQLITNYPVPLGFCLPTTLLSATEELDNLENDRVSSDMRHRLSTAYAMLEERCQRPNINVAVRSSAIGEDSLTDSFAGQYETYLNIVGKEAVIEAVIRCWRSAYQARVQTYRRQRGLETQQTQLAILVQQLILADVAGVVFSCHPVTGNREEIMINVSWGLGESIVGGTVTPDTFIVNKSTLTIADRHIAQKQYMTVMVANGTQELSVPRLMRGQPAITDAQAIEMAQLALKLETEMGWPVDIECAYQDNTLYLLQCRSVTTVV